MMMNLFAGLGVWTVASVGLGLLVGRAIRGYSIEPALSPVTDNGTPSPYRRHAA